MTRPIPCATFAAIGALVVLASLPQLAAGRTHENVIPTTTDAAMVSAETGTFNCGTYPEAGKSFAWHYYYDQALRRASAADRTSRAPTQSFIYDDVWIVEDDGELLLTGSNNFDTPGTGFHYVPNIAGGYDLTYTTPFFLPPPPDSTLTMGDDTEVVRALGFSFSYFGQTWTEVHVGSNGVVGFGANPNPSGFYDASDFYSSTPKIAVYFLDLNPSSGLSGDVYFESNSDSAVVTWWQVIEFGSSSFNTMKLILRADGTFDIHCGAIGSTTQNNGSPIVMGMSPGGDAPALERINMSADVPYSGSGGAGIYEDYFNLGAPMVNETGLGRRFYETFPDSFFQYVYFTNFSQTMAGFANEVNIENGVTGIGLSIFDNSGVYGSNGILESRCNMNSLAAWPTPNPAQRALGTQSFLTIMGQESGHRWGAFTRFMDGGSNISNMILGRANAHWSYYLDIDHSCLEGGNWEQTAATSFVCPDLVDGFSDVDEYMMGLRTAEEVTPMFYVSSAANDQTGLRSQSPPPIGATAFGTPVTVTIDDIIAAEGLRTPLPDVEEKDLRQAFIFILQNGTFASQAELDKIAGFRRAWEDYFEASCDGRLSVNTSLTRTFATAVLHGDVIDRLTDQPVENFTVRSLQRGFDQLVPAGGRYEFRYRSDVNEGLWEWVTIATQAPGYYPDTLTTAIPYGGGFEIDIVLDPVPASVTDGSRTVPNTLYQNFPNPFNPSTTIPYDLKSSQHVMIQVFDVRGALVRTLVDAEVAAGHHRVVWDGRDNRGHETATGFYAYRLTAGDFVETRKMVLVK